MRDGVAGVEAPTAPSEFIIDTGSKTRPLLYIPGVLHLPHAAELRVRQASMGPSLFRTENRPHPNLSPFQELKLGLREVQKIRRSIA